MALGTSLVVRRRVTVVFRPLSFGATATRCDVVPLAEVIARLDVAAVVPSTGSTLVARSSGRTSATNLPPERIRKSSHTFPWDMARSRLPLRCTGCTSTAIRAASADNPGRVLMTRRQATHNDRSMGRETYTRPLVRRSWVFVLRFHVAPTTSDATAAARNYRRWSGAIRPLPIAQAKPGLLRH